MSWSLGEARSLAVKAARGVGMAWGLAEETGFAVHWLQAQGAPGLQALAAYLRMREKGGRQAEAACPIALGCRLLDAGLEAPSDLGPVRQPLLLAPFIAAATPAGTTCLTWAEVELRVSQQGLATAADRDGLLVEQAACRLAESGDGLSTSRTCQRVPESEGAAMTLLKAFAARTYAPSTEQSRLAGAGAGVTDND